MTTLLKSILVVRTIETSKLRQEIFCDIAQKNKIIGWVDTIFRKASGTPLAGFLVLLYGLKCFLSVDSPRNEHIDVLALATFPNEVNAINRLQAKIPASKIELLRCRTRNLLQPTSFARVFSYVKSSPRLARFARRLAARYGFMPACRVFSVVPFYIRLNAALSETTAKGVLVASQYSPEALGLITAARNRSLSVLFTNHSHIPAKMPSIRPPAVDLAILTSMISFRRYSKQANSCKDWALIGSGCEAVDSPRPSPPSKPRRVGFFLTALTAKSELLRCIEDLASDFRNTKVFIRPHPVSLLDDDFSGLIETYPEIEISSNSTLSDDIAKCDLVVCGNSGVIIEVLAAACPVLYMPSLDRLPFDYNGFVETGLVPSANRLDRETLNGVGPFYSSSAWPKAMGLHDSRFECGADTSDDNLVRKLFHALNGGQD